MSSVSQFTFSSSHSFNIKHKRHAVVSAIAASGVAPLVLARGHRVYIVPWFLVVGDPSVENIEKTKDVVALLKKIGAYTDV
jgi:large subunit ribosomal protein L4e